MFKKFDLEYEYFNWCKTNPVPSEINSTTSIAIYL